MMKKSVLVVSIVTLLSLVLVTAAFAAPEPEAEPSPAPAPMADGHLADAAAESTIVDIALANDGFSTLVAAVVAADLVDVLSSGSFTVFAPSNDAFKLTLDELGIEAADLLADKELLTSILLYHVVPGEVYAADVLAMNQLTMADGNFALAYATSDGAFINGAPISNTDIKASNGVIHVIDRVILPPSYSTSSTQSIVDIAVADGRFTTLVAAAQAAGLADTLANDGYYTVFAPTDDAFAAAFAALGITPEALLADTATLTAILKYHVTTGAMKSGEVVGMSSVPMLNGGLAEVTNLAGEYYIDGAKLIITDIEASNGVIHVIDAVMLP